MGPGDAALRSEWLALYRSSLQPELEPLPPRVLPEATKSVPLPEVVSAVTRCAGVAAMTHEQKMEQAITGCSLWPALKSQVNLPELIEDTIVTVGALTLLAATGFGAVAEGIGAGLIVVGGFAAGYKIGDAVNDLYDFFELTRCDRAKTDADLAAAGRKFASGVTKAGIGGLMLLLSAKGAKGRSLRGARIKAPPEMSGYGDLTADELAALKRAAAKSGEEIDVVGSTAKGTRRGAGSDLPIGKGDGTKSDLDIRLDSEADIRSGGRASEAVYEEFPKGKDVDRILSGEPYEGEPRITVKPDGSVEASPEVPVKGK